MDINLRSQNFGFFFYCVFSFCLGNNKNMKKKILILFFSLSAVSVLLFVIFNFFVQKKDYQQLVEKYSAEYGLEKELVLAVIKAESDFNEKAVSKSGARGLMQIMPTTGKWIASELDKGLFLSDDLFDAETNVEFGCFYLNYLFGKFSDLKAVICAYNAGETVVRAWLDEEGFLMEEKIEFSETKIYLQRVLEFYEIYKKR